VRLRAFFDVRDEPKYMGVKVATAPHLGSISLGDGRQTCRQSVALRHCRVTYKDRDDRYSAPQCRLKFLTDIVVRIVKPKATLQRTVFVSRTQPLVPNHDEKNVTPTNCLQDVPLKVGPCRNASYVHEDCLSPEMTL
jgi:hypothetical protein